jgi:hypothetical protein
MKSGSQGVGDLKDGTQPALGRQIQFIGVHRRLKSIYGPNAKALQNNSLAADEPLMSGDRTPSIMKTGA